MTEWSSGASNIIDCHVHVRNLAQWGAMRRIREGVGINRMNLVSIQSPGEGSGLPQSLYVKAQAPERFYVFAGLNHAEALSAGEVSAPSLAEQAKRYMEMGCDGIKMIEGKPTSRQVMDIPVDGPYFAEYWECVEELGIPIVWHVNDPEEFWDPDALPDWAQERNWGYGPEDVTKEQMYAEVDEVLRRHPNLKVIFAHFYFLSADLERAGRFFDEHPTVQFDLAPGIEMLYNISRDPDAGREFFIEYADRIVFGTDISSGHSIEEATIRAGIVFRWLETDDTFRVPGEADFLLGPPEDGIIRGMSLPEDVLDRIYRANFTRVAGDAPRPVDVGAAIEECELLASIAEEMSGVDGSETDAGEAAERLRGL